jgi:outer membrane lipoprotein-sorting protein
MSLRAAAFAVLALVSTGVGAQTAQEIVVASDKVRNPEQPFSLTNTLVEYRSGKAQNRMVLGIYAKEDKANAQFRNLVRFVDPPRDVGKLMLKNGNILWFYDPASKASVRMSPQQRLLGQASNGDVLTVNLAKDYAATLAGEEQIQDADRKPRETWKLDLSAVDDSVTYFRIELWIEKGTYQGIKGRFFSDSGRLLKTAYYRKLEEHLGGLRPTEAIIIDGVDTSLVTRMNFTDYKARDIPESWFQRDFLPRFQPE